MWHHVSCVCVRGMSQPPGIGEDVRIDCVWLYGVVSFKDFCDLMI